MKNFFESLGKVCIGIVLAGIGFIVVSHLDTHGSVEWKAGQQIASAPVNEEDSDGVPVPAGKTYSPEARKDMDRVVESAQKYNPNPHDDCSTGLVNLPLIGCVGG